MTFESFGNLISLFCTIVGLLYSVFKYAEMPKPGFRYITIFFLALFFNEYYWTVYEFIMHSSPDVSGFTSYLGWNIAIVFLLLISSQMRNEKSKRFFHPLLVILVFANAFQFFLYIQYGGFFNNFWQVSFTTSTMVFCLQDLLYYRKAKSCPFPWLSFLIFSYLICQYGMWTASCFDWSSFATDPYLYFSVISPFLCLFFPLSIRAYYRAELPDSDSASDKKSAVEMRFQVMVQTVASLVIIGICGLGFFTVFWIRDALIHTQDILQIQKQIVVYLFILSIVLIFLVLILLYSLTSRYRYMLQNRMRMTDIKRSRLNFFFTIVLTLTLMAFAVFYNNFILYRASILSVYENAEKEIETTSTELENYLTVASTTLRVAADSVGLMVDNADSIEEIRQFIVDQTTIQSAQFDENFTGIYAYIDGEYLDGLNWIPPEDYVATERDWYKAVSAGNGDIVIVSPYVDAQTGSVVITIGKAIARSRDPKDAGKQNVVCLDVIVNHVQDVTEAVEIAGKGYGIVVNSDGFIVAHREKDYNGQNFCDIYSPELLQNIRDTKKGRLTTTVQDEDCTLFISPVMDQWYALIVIPNAALFEETYSQLAVSIMVSLIIFCFISFFYYMGYKNEQIYGRKLEEMNIQVVTALATAIDAKDKYTNGHSLRVAEYSRMIAARAGFSKARQDEIYMMGLLHDVGKIGVPDYVINKTSDLSEEEFTLIKKHPVIGNEILQSIKERPHLAIGAHWHHEHFDGNGYPDGIAGEAIPEEARIIAVADAYDAMTSRRSYRDIIPQTTVREEIRKGMGTQFDPYFAELFLQIIDEDREYRMHEDG